jgi:hypothetical protein
MNRHQKRRTRATDNSGRVGNPRSWFPPICILAAAIALLSSAPASASEQVHDYFGTDSASGSLGGQFYGLTDIAVNAGANGPANAGDIYVVDGGNQRIQRFAQNDGGTPANPYDDTYPFVSAWGAGVLAGGTNYEICTLAASCRQASASGGNGTPMGNGGFSGPSGVAVDQDTGNVYVADNGNHRIDVYTGDGQFLRAFGFDVVASGPDNAGSGYEVCIAASGDVCKAGVSGSGVGQAGGIEGIAVSQPDGNPSSGTVFVADWGNGRIDTYDLGGGSPALLGSSAEFASSWPRAVAVDSRGILYASSNNNPREIARFDTENVNGAGVGFLAPISSPPLLSGGNNGIKGIKVAPDPDGAGPESDSLYVLMERGADPESVIQQFGPANAPGLVAPPSLEDDEHGAIAEINYGLGGLGLDPRSKRLFISDSFNIGGPWNNDLNFKHGVYVLDDSGGTPSVALESLTDITATTVTVNGTVDPSGPPDVSFHAEYSLDGTEWTAVPDVPVGSQTDPQSVSTVVNPPAGGLRPNTLYHVRLVATRRFYPPTVSSELTFTTSAAPALVETTGSPVRDATDARLDSRIDPQNSSTTYHFEYGAQGPCDVGSCESTEAQQAGSGGEFELVSQRIENLQPGTTYHYRVIAENAAGVSAGSDMTLTTRFSDAPLEHGSKPGPPGSNRAYEMVSLPDAGGNPVQIFLGASNSAERVAYQIQGGNPNSETANNFSQFFAERTADGWKSVPAFPKRQELVGTAFFGLAGSDDLTSMATLNNSLGIGEVALFKLSFDSPAIKLRQAPQTVNMRPYTISDNGQLVVAFMPDTQDSLHPSIGGFNLYDVTSDPPRLLDLLPDGSVPPCGADPDGAQVLRRDAHWVSADASRVFFASRGASCSGVSQVYLRDLAAEESVLLSGPPLSGPTCPATFIRSTADAAFFVTKTRLDSADQNAPEGCEGAPGTDVYRFSFQSKEVKCVTCVTREIAADIRIIGPSASDVAVAPDGSRVYFGSPHTLLSGAAPGLYRVDVNTGQLAYIAATQSAGEIASLGNWISSNGSYFVFRSSTSGLNALGGQQNGGTSQYYLYHDQDHSLSCVSCPLDGAPAKDSAALPRISGDQEGGPHAYKALADDGTFAFATPDSLVTGDQNSAGGGEAPGTGADIYEWRDGRPLLVTDGLTTWPKNSGSQPFVGGISSSGHDLFFIAPIQYTADALDGLQRIYDARIGGGFNFLPPPKPCPLEVCQGTPKGAAEETLAGTSTFVGPPNARPSHRARRCRGRKRADGRCKAAKHHRRHKRDLNQRDLNRDMQSQGWRENR